MEHEILAVIAKDLHIISRSLVYLCMEAPEMREASVGQKARTLRSFGLDNGEIAELVGTTANTIAVRLAEAKKKNEDKKSRVPKKNTGKPVPAVAAKVE